MVAPVPAQISKLPPRLPAAPLRHPLLTRPTTHYLLPAIPLRDLCAPASVISVLRFSPSSGAQASQLFCLHRTRASLSSLCALSSTRFLCFQHLAASFQKTPGWGLPRFQFQPPTAHYPLLTTHFPLSTFRMNTCESVSKQRTLTIFRMNTYVKRGEGGYRAKPCLVPRSQTHTGSCDAWHVLAAKRHLRETFPRTPSYIKASTCRERTCKPRLLEGPVREGEISP
jgi:hypothetical protein